VQLSRFSSALNIAWICVLLCVLAGSFYIQFVIGEQPCRLCTWQRMSMFLIVASLLLNVKFGQSNIHYGLIIIFSLFGASVSTRQILSYIIPGSPGFGPVVFGMHTYTWALIVFLSSILASGWMLIINADRHYKSAETSPRLVKGIFGFSIIASIAFSVATLFQCGLDVCPAATEYIDSPKQGVSMEDLCCPNTKKNK